MLFEISHLLCSFFFDNPFENLAESFSQHRARNIEDSIEGSRNVGAGTKIDYEDQYATVRIKGGK